MMQHCSGLSPAQAQGQDIEEFKNVKRWLEELASRPALQRGMAIGKDLTVDPTTLPPEELERRAKIFNDQCALPVP